MQANLPQIRLKFVGLFVSQFFTRKKKEDLGKASSTIREGHEMLIG